MSIEGAIFDMDGTLIESMHLWQNIAYRYLKEKYRIIPTNEEKKKMQGMMMEELGDTMISLYSLPTTREQIVKDINKMTEIGYFHEVHKKPYVEKILISLKEKGIPMCIATATEYYLTDGCLKRLGLKKYFDKIFTCHDYHTTKYGPVLFNEAGKFLGTKKENTFVFEDTLDSIHGAKEAGFPVIAVPDRWQRKDREEIKKAADFFIESFKEFPSLNLL